MAGRLHAAANNQQHMAAPLVIHFIDSFQMYDNQRPDVGCWILDVGWLGGQQPMLAEATGVNQHPRSNIQHLVQSCCVENSLPARSLWRFDATALTLPPP